MKLKIKNSVPDSQQPHLKYLISHLWLVATILDSTGILIIEVSASLVDRGKKFFLPQETQIRGVSHVHQLGTLFHGVFFLAHVREVCEREKSCHAPVQDTAFKFTWYLALRNCQTTTIANIGFAAGLRLQIFPPTRDRPPCSSFLFPFLLFPLQLTQLQLTG